MPMCWRPLPKLRRDPAQYLGFVEVHIEQGPVLNAMNLPLGVVTSINASVRYSGEVVGTACHAGTTPMHRRQDAACAAAELALVPGTTRCPRRRFSRHHGPAQRARRQRQCGARALRPSASILRAPNDLQRNDLERDVLEKMQQICKQRGLTFTLQETMRASAAPAHRPCNNTGKLLWQRWVCRSTACPAVPATTR
jgi:N-carbamoyl-L-amino-acid hydrolase